jgi:hypothetical protein
MDQNYANLKVTELKDLLRQRQLRITGTKAELIQRLIDNDANAPAAAPVGLPAPIPALIPAAAPAFTGNAMDLMKINPERINDPGVREKLERELKTTIVVGLRQYAREIGAAIPPRAVKNDLVNGIITHIEQYPDLVRNIEREGTQVEAAPRPQVALPGIGHGAVMDMARAHPIIINNPDTRAQFEEELRRMPVQGLRQYAQTIGAYIPPKAVKNAIIQLIIAQTQQRQGGVVVGPYLNEPIRPRVPSPPIELPRLQPIGHGNIVVGQRGPAVYQPPGRIGYQAPRGADEYGYQPPKKEEKKGITHPVSPLTIKGISDTIKNIPLDDDAPLKTLTKKYTFNRRSNTEIAKLISDHQFGEGTNPLTFNNRLYLVDILTAEPNRLVPVGAALNYKLANQSFDDGLQLLWWENIFDAPDRLHPAEKRFVSELNRDQLLEILAPTGYNGPSDPASLIWAIVKRQMPTRPDITKEPRYPGMLEINKDLVLRDAVLLHNYYNPELEVPSFFTPPRHLAIGQESPLDPFILTYNGDVDGFAQALQMIFPVSVKTKEEKEEYFFKNLKYYADIFTRPDEIIPPPDITGMTKDRVKNILRQYTDEELADAYEITSHNWTSRKDFIDKLAEEARGGARWFYRKKNCTNENTVNIATGDRGRDKNDPTDPVISYGTMKEYRCYNISELELSFRETEVGFQFAVPDWETGQPMQTFPIESIRQLRQMLVDANDTALYGELIKKIDEGFAQMNNAGRRLRSLKAQYDAFPADRKELVRDYLAWMFLYAMWMRFWQGPGRIYPVIWKEGGGTTGAGGEYCELATRDVNVIYMQNVRTEILNAMPRDLEEWVLQLPRVRYNFQTGEPTLGQETIDFLIQKVIEGNFCLADASDKTGQTAYYLITRLFSMNDAELNAFIKEEIPRIYQKYEIPLEKATLESIVRGLEKKDIEKDKKKIEQQVDRLKKVVAKLYETPPAIVVDPTNKVKLLQQAKGLLTQLPQLQAQKLRRVQDQAQKQPDFNPGGMTLTYHTDPYVTIRDVTQ